jgi:hypothetical protein
MDRRAMAISWRREGQAALTRAKRDACEAVGDGVRRELAAGVLPGVGDVDDGLWRARKSDDEHEDDYGRGGCSGMARRPIHEEIHPCASTCAHVRPR